MSIQLKQLTDMVKKALPAHSLHRPSGLMNGRNGQMEDDDAPREGGDEPEIVYLTAA